MTNWRCTATRSHGTCGCVNSDDEETCGACGADQPPPAERGSEAEREPDSLIARLERALAFVRLLPEHMEREEMSVRQILEYLNRGAKRLDRNS